MPIFIISPAVGFAFAGDGAGVVAAGSNGLEADAGWHLDGDWDAGVGGRVVTQLTTTTISPAVGFAFAGDGAGVVAAGSNGLEADAGWHLDGDWDAGVGGRVVTQLTTTTISPAVGFAFAGDGAGVVAAGSNGLEADAGWHLDGDWDAGVGGRVVTQLTLVIQPPAVGLTSGSEGAGVVNTSSDGLEADAGWHLDGDWDAGVGGRVVTQLTLVIQPPAVGLTSGSEGAGVVNTSSDGLEADAGWHLDGDWDAGVGGRVVTQLTLVIQPPAVGLTSGSEGAGVVITSGNLTK